ncbi:unnamed protein product, partial [Staurois parvus]
QIRGTHHLPGADTDWLLTGNRVQSGHYQTSDHNGRGVVPHIDPLGHRMLSAGKGKNKFPWENQVPGVTDMFPGTHNADQLSSVFDVHHTPIVKTPTAKVRNSSAKQASATFSMQKEPLPAFTGNDDAPVPLKASLV